MALRMFSVIGEALNFGAFRLGVIARVAWVPVILMMIVNLATIFASLSVIFDRPITLADVSYMGAAAELDRNGAIGWARAPLQMGAITASAIVLQLLLVASFMAPLIRYSGLGERPAPGPFRLLFGADQIRFILAAVASLLLSFIILGLPIMGATYHVLSALHDAMSQTMAVFPDESSLHTIEIVKSGQVLIQNGEAWFHSHTYPLIVVLPFAALIWLLAFLHFRPANRPSAPETGNPVLRALIVLLVVGGISVGVYGFIHSATAQTAGEGVTLAGAPIAAVLMFVIAGFWLLSYAQIRLFPYPAVAVCRKSMGLGSTFAVTRGWNLFRLTIIFVLISASLTIVSFLINALALPMILSTLSTLFQATETTTRLINSGVTGDWVLPLFIWIWNIITMAIAIFWTFFSYGVLAGLYGRLYRDSVE